MTTLQKSSFLFVPKFIYKKSIISGPHKLPKWEDHKWFQFIRRVIYCFFIILIIITYYCKFVCYFYILLSTTRNFYDINAKCNNFLFFYSYSTELCFPFTDLLSHILLWFCIFLFPQFFFFLLLCLLFYCAYLKISFYVFLSYSWHLRKNCLRILLLWKKIESEMLQVCDSIYLGFLSDIKAVLEPSPLDWSKELTAN